MESLVEKRDLLEKAFIEKKAEFNNKKIEVERFTNYNPKKATLLSYDLQLQEKELDMLKKEIERLDTLLDLNEEKEAPPLAKIQESSEIRIFDLFKTFYTAQHQAYLIKTSHQIGYSKRRKILNFLFGRNRKVAMSECFLEAEEAGKELIPLLEARKETPKIRELKKEISDFLTKMEDPWNYELYSRDQNPKSIPASPGSKFGIHSMHEWLQDLEEEELMVHRLFLEEE